MKYRFTTDKSRVEQCAEQLEEDFKESSIFWLLFFKFWNLIWRPNLNFWRSEGPNFTRVFVKASNGKIFYLMVENQSWLDPTATKCFQRLYKDLMVKFESKFDLRVKINLTCIFLLILSYFLELFKYSHQF